MSTTKRRPPIKPSSAQPKKRRARNDFSLIMEKATRSMPRSRRIFSRFIHLDTVYLVSDFLGATVARPNAILFGAVTSFFVTLATYLLAKNFGYSLSGFESIGAFAAGWVLGIVYDLFAFLLRKK